MKQSYRRLSRVAVIGILCAGSLFAQMRIVGTFGRSQVQGRNAIVHVTIAIPPGVDMNQAAVEALRNQGARPIQAQEFATTGMVWDQFSDGNPGNDSVDTWYNPAGDPTGGAGEPSVIASQQTWSEVPESSFAFSYIGNTGRCPSLVRECGSQEFDGNNDVGWADLGCGNIIQGVTLGVTWFSTEIDEFDMALNNGKRRGRPCVNWSTDGVNDIDLQTVHLHEYGHGLGLGHSEFANAVMYAYYSGVNRSLRMDDVAGLAYLYPSDPPVCGDSICDLTEDSCTCAVDCGPPPSSEVNYCSDSLDNDCDGSIDGDDSDCCLDADNDGFTTCAGDCNDNNADINPGAPEVCSDSIDNNCNGEADEGCSGGTCELGQPGDPCTSDSQCCSNKCRGRPGGKICR